ncbi:MAG: hypothetical protein R3195_12020 [Gemmatimonadota bacterium]|nr:hypothetical protein [Gemmatimonadota bacterium]
MLKSRAVVLSLVLSPFLAACGSSLTVEVLTEGADGQTPVADLEVVFLPYDRDSLFNAMAQASPTPEPQVPAALRTQIDSVQALQETWRTAEASWNAVRDSLRQLSDRLSGMDSRSREYLQLFDTFGDMEGRERTLNTRRQRAFDAFTALQTSTQAQMDSVRAVIQSWEDVAFADYADIQADLLEALGAEVVYDTTDANGLVTRSLGGGDWWVHARVPAPSGELYWNVLAGGVDTLRLTPDNAERRLAF